MERAGGEGLFKANAKGWLQRLLVLCSEALQKITYKSELVLLPVRACLSKHRPFFFKNGASRANLPQDPHLLCTVDPTTSVFKNRV
jgi:hypothetical protein